MVQVIDSITTVVRESSKIAKPRQTRQARRPVAELYQEPKLADILKPDWGQGDGVERALNIMAQVSQPLVTSSTGGGSAPSPPVPSAPTAAFNHLYLCIHCCVPAPALQVDGWLEEGTVHLQEVLRGQPDSLVGLVSSIL